MSGTARNEKGVQTLLRVTLGGAVVWQVVMALFFLLRAGKSSLAISCFASAAVLFTGLVVCFRPGMLAWLGRPIYRQVTASMALAWVVWAGIIVATIITFRARGWDECCYLLSGLAIRGYGTPYMADRPPVTHFIAAIFVDAPQFLNAALLIALVTLLTVWGKARWGWSLAALPLLMLAGQNAFLESVFHVMAELPAAIVLVLGYFLLARERFFAAGMIFALSGLARWNLAVVPVALAAIIPFRFGWGAFVRYALGGVVVGVVFFGLSFALVNDPIHRIVQGSLMSSYQWTPPGEAKPNFFIRSAFYFPHAFFVTPWALLAIVACLVSGQFRRAATAEDWTFRVGMPVGIAAYGLTMLMIGGLFVRFMSPVIPLALLVLTDFAMQCAGKFSLLQTGRQLLFAVTGVVTLAWGIWPAGLLPWLKHQDSVPPIFTREFQRDTIAHTAKKEVIYVPAILPLAESNAYPVMFALRRTVEIPTAQRDSNQDVLPESDERAACESLLTRLPANASVIVPKTIAGFVRGQILASDGNWVLIRSEGVAKAL